MKTYTAYNMNTDRQVVRIEVDGRDDARLVLKALEDAARMFQTEENNDMLMPINLYTARSLGCGTTLVAVIAATTPDEALQLIKAERGEGWALTERQVQVTVNIDKPRIIVIV